MGATHPVSSTPARAKSGFLAKAYLERLCGTFLPEWDTVARTITTHRLQPGQVLFDVAPRH